MAIPEGLPLYREALRADQSDEDWEEDEDPVTAACVEAIVTLQAREAIPDLRRLLRSRQPFNRAAAAVALARLGDRGSVPLLVAFLDDPFEARNGDNRDDDEKFIPVRRVWHAAMEALEILSGQKAEGRSVAQRRASWKAWYEKHRDAFK
jgi:HEAT repeat protein